MVFVSRSNTPYLLVFPAVFRLILFRLLPRLVDQQNNFSIQILIAENFKSCGCFVRGLCLSAIKGELINMKRARSEQAKGDRRQDILTCAEAVILECGLENLSMAQVAKRAGLAAVSRPKKG